MSAFSRAKLHHLTVNVLIRQLVAPLTSGLGACMLGPSSSSLERNRIGRVRHSTASGGQIDEYERALCAPCLQAGHIFILSEFFLSMACASVDHGAQRAIARVSPAERRASAANATFSLNVQVALRQQEHTIQSWAPIVIFALDKSMRAGRF